MIPILVTNARPSFLTVYCVDCKMLTSDITNYPNKFLIHSGNKITL
jgi:hypothetical protein